MASTNPCNSWVAASALKSASDIQRIHGGRREPSRGRAPALSGRPAAAGHRWWMYWQPFVGGSGRGKSRSSAVHPVGQIVGTDGRTTVALLVTPSVTLAPSTGFTNVTVSFPQCSPSCKNSLASKLVSPTAMTGVAGGVQQIDGNQFAGFDELLVWPLTSS